MSVFLCMTVMLSAFAFCIAASDETLPFAVATDLHYALTPKTAPVNFPGDKYYCADTVATMITETKAIIKQFLREVEATDAKFVLLCGDLTENGTIAQHQGLAGFLKDFEDRTGKTVYVIDGNHDFHAGISVQKFKDIYADFGYNEALTVDQKTCSYTADLDSRYRLLALDSCMPGSGGDGFTPELLQWAAQQAETAKKDGKKLIVMQHHSFLEHIPMQATLMPNFITRPELDLKTHFINMGVRYVFTGHMHSHDITSYSNDAGKKVYDILTTALSGYPCGWRMCTLSEEGLDIQTRRMQGVDAADLPQSGYTPELLAELTGDLETFANGCFKASFSIRRNTFFSKSAIREILGKFGGASVQGIIDAFYPTFYHLLTLPIYTADAADGESLQAYGEKMGLEFPQTDKKDIFDSLYYFITVLYDGDENIPANDPEIVLAVQCAYTALYTSMQTISSGLRTKLLNSLRSNLVATMMPLVIIRLLKAALGTVKDDKLLETVLLFAAPFVEAFSVDDETNDNDAFLADEDGNLTAIFTNSTPILQRIWMYIKRIFQGVVQTCIPFRSVTAVF